jgi:hypothetical protein
VRAGDSLTCVRRGHGRGRRGPLRGRPVRRRHRIDRRGCARWRAAARTRRRLRRMACGILDTTAGLMVALLRVLRMARRHSPPEARTRHDCGAAIATITALGSGTERCDELSRKRPATIYGSPAPDHRGDRGEHREARSSAREGAARLSDRRASAHRRPKSNAGRRSGPDEVVSSVPRIGHATCDARHSRSSSRWSDR